MSPRALADLHRQEQALRWQRWTRSVLLLVATVLSLTTVGLFTADQLYRPDTFVIDQLKIKGRFRYLQPADIETLVKQQEIGNFFSIRLNEIQRQIEAMPWVQEAQVRREWPNTLLINVVEQRPVMRWEDDRWVNRLGEVIRLPEPVKLPGAVQLSGSERLAGQMLTQALVWSTQLAEFGLDLRGMSVSDSEAWVLRLGVPAQEYEFSLTLGSAQVEKRLQRFLMLYRSQLLATGKQIEFADARYPNGLAVRTSPEPDSEDSLNQPIAAQEYPQ